MKRVLLISLLAPLAVTAHDGHGAAGAHWHATDAWGFIALAIALAAAVWFSRRK
jgi:uncharacterized membrane protein AbrB (regulator of aidB expression)